jgi:ubiquinone/menaquinone biosynthesis C-methylase UbiE
MTAPYQQKPGEPLPQFYRPPLQCHCNAGATPPRSVGVSDTSHCDTRRRVISTMNEDKLNEFLGKFVTDLGATVAAGNVVIGHRLGLYRALARGPATPGQFAERTGTTPRYIAEWLRGQAAGGYITWDAAQDRYTLTEEQAFVLANPDGAVYAPGAFVLALGALRAEERIAGAFRSGAGLGWHEHDESVFTGCEQFFRPGYIANLVPAWIPALDGVDGKLRAGAVVADIGCGLGASAVLLAQHYPNSRIAGSDYHDRSIELARRRATDAGIADRVTFEVAGAGSFSGSGYDLATTFDCLHDMGDPLGAARHIRQALKPDGSWLVVEPYAADEPAANMNPIGRVYYNFSTLLCVPNAMSQPGGYALGAQAGEAAIRRLVTEAGFTRFRRAAETPFNLVYEVRP